MDQDGQNTGAFDCPLRKDWPLARQIATIEAVLTLEATNIRIPTLITASFVAGMGTGGWAGEHRVALIGGGFCHRLR
jgi:hypothetical protein